MNTLYSILPGFDLYQTIVNDNERAQQTYKTEQTTRTTTGRPADDARGRLDAKPLARQYQRTTRPRHSAV
jgi:hypothetical protein